MRQQVFLFPLWGILLFFGAASVGFAQAPTETKGKRSQPSKINRKDVPSKKLDNAVPDSLRLEFPYAEPTRLLNVDQEEDNPEARRRYEMMLLRDPATGSIPADIRVREQMYAATLPTRQDLTAKGASELLRAAPGTWQARGPINVGGRTRALAVDVTDPNVILAGGVSGGLWRSTNGGELWRLTTERSEQPSVTCIAQDTRPGKTSTWYYGTGEYRGNSASLQGDGLYKSTDGGLTWTILPSTSRGTPNRLDQMFDYTWNIAVDTSNHLEDELYVATYGGVVRSTDGGSSWTDVLGSFGNKAGYTDVAITSDGVVYGTISTGGNVRGIWRSADGTNWTNITPAGWPGSYGRIVVAPAPSNEDIVYFLAYTPGREPNGHSLWRLDASTGEWTDFSDALPDKFETYVSYCMVLKVKPDDEDVLFVGGVTLMRLEGQLAPGAKWTALGGANQHADQHALVFMPNAPQMMLAGHDGGVSFTADNLAPSVEWEALNDGYTTSQFYTIALDHAVPGNDVIIGGLQDNGTWVSLTDEDQKWTKVYGADGAFCAVADSGSSFYSSTQNGNIFRLILNENGRRESFTKVTPTGASGFFFVHPFALDPSDTRVMYLPAGEKLWRNSNLTEIPMGSGAPTKVNWTELENSEVTAGSITAVGVSRTAPAHRVYFGTNFGRIYRIDNAVEGDPEPVEVTGTDMPGNGYLKCLAVDPSDGNRVIAVFSNYNIQSLFLTEDGGKTWEAIGGNLEENPNGQGAGPSCRWVKILPLHGQTLHLVGTSTGLYSSVILNGNNTVWMQEAPDLIGNVVVDMIDARSADGYVVVGTHGRGVYSTHFAQLPAFASISISPMELNLGSAAIDEQVVDTIVVLNQSGSTRQLLGSIGTLTQPFSIINGSGTFTLAPGSSTDVLVGFQPKSSGTYSDTLYIVHDGVNATAPMSVVVRGSSGVSGINEETAGRQQSGIDVNLLPNPASGIATLQLALKRAGDVRVSILTTRGQEIAVPHEGYLDAGNHNLAWDTANLPAGLYVCRVTQKGRSSVRRVLIVR